MSKKPIVWKLVTLEKALIRPNPFNPKVKNEKGLARLTKLTQKYGVIYDGIVNADYSMIDGHARLEMYPEGTGNYFVPDRQLGEEDEKELNALFDYARAGDPDLFMIENILGEEVLDEWDPKQDTRKLKKKDKNAKYPLIPQYDERHEAILILCTNSIDTTFIKNALSISKGMSYKNRSVKETAIVTAKQFIDKWKSKSR